MPKAEWNRANGATQTIYPLCIKFKRQRSASSLDRADAFTRWWVSVPLALNSAVRSNVKRLNSVKNTNDSVI